MLQVVVVHAMTCVLYWFIELYAECDALVGRVGNECEGVMGGLLDAGYRPMS